MCNNNTKHKVIPFPQSPFEDWLDEQRQLYLEGRLLDFVCISSNSFLEGEEIEGNASEIRHYWFGTDSTIRCLGLIEVMKQAILTYMET